MKLKILNSETAIYTLLLFVSATIYAFYYQHLIFNLNAVLYGIEGDSLKNYYTFVYHIKNDSSLLHFSGLNFPFGEHIVYTDCQPLLTFILKALPFTHPYLIGVMHGLIIFSFIITPLILYRIFSVLNTSKTVAFLSALAIGVLSPQTHRVGGHFALAYGCIIPLGILFLVNYLAKHSAKRLWILAAYNSILFFVHPYFGLGLSLFCLTTILIHECFNYDRTTAHLKRMLFAFIIGIFPIVLFKIFMLLTDQHSGRPDEPYGVDIMGAAATTESVFTPSFGPFVNLMKSFFRAKHEWEALSYIGIFSCFFLVLNILLLPFYLYQLKLKTGLTAMFLSAILFLLVSFGKHIDFLKFFNIEIATLNQFRAFGRFAWYFYFLLPIFLICTFTAFVRNFSPKYEKIILPALALVFFSFNMLEANYLLRTMTDGTFKERNVFSSTHLTSGEKAVISKIKNVKFQAILPVPIFHIGSEVYQRNGEESAGPAMIYSYHTGLPVLSVMMSRTSLTETETSLEVLNSFKQQRKILDLLTEDPLLVIRTGDKLKKDEMRLLNKLNIYDKNDHQEFFTASKKDLILTKNEVRQFISINPDSNYRHKNISFILTESRKPFTNTRISNYETILDVDSTEVDPGLYTVSFHYHLKQKKFRYIHNNFIVVKKNAGQDNWQYFTSVRSTSGFYHDFIVFEERIRIDPHANYRFLLNGPMKEKYRISNFLLKPDSIDVMMLQGKVMLYNNYPDRNAMH